MKNNQASTLQFTRTKKNIVFVTTRHFIRLNDKPRLS